MWYHVQLMRDPVFLQSERTYERSAIENWFNTCRLQGQQPTCPVSGQILTSTDLRPSLVLRQTIQEWEQRNVAIRIRQVVTRLGATASVRIPYRLRLNHFPAFDLSRPH